MIKQEIVIKILSSINDRVYITNYQLNITPREFYRIIIELIDAELLINIPNPVYSDKEIIHFSISGSELTSKGKNMLEKYIIQEEKHMTNGVFIVHGHDDALKDEVARTIEKVGLRAIILNEEVNSGLTIIQKFEKYAKNANYAIVLMTPDDRGKAKTDTKYKDRARQNVVLEWGYFAGKLGVDRVSTMHIGSIELPSDISGILHIQYDKSGGWKIKLLKELEAVGYNINWSNI